MGPKTHPAVHKLGPGARADGQFGGGLHLCDQRLHPVALLHQDHLFRCRPSRDAIYRGSFVRLPQAATSLPQAATSPSEASAVALLGVPSWRAAARLSPGKCVTFINNGAARISAVSRPHRPHLVQYEPHRLHGLGRRGATAASAPAATERPQPDTTCRHNRCTKSEQLVSSRLFERALRPRKKAEVGRYVIRGGCLDVACVRVS